MKNEKGFTLIELLVVILIIGILLAMIMPNFSMFTERARIASVKSNMHVVQTCIEAFATDHMGAYPSADYDGYGGAIAPDDAVGFYFPGGDPVAGTPGNLPVNPYTGIRCNEGDYEDLTYADLLEVDPGLLAITNNLNGDSPYVDMAGSAAGSGHISIGVALDPVGGVAVVEYGVAGFGRFFADEYPIHDVSGDDPTDDANYTFFALHN